MAAAHRSAGEAEPGRAGYQGPVPLPGSLTGHRGVCVGSAAQLATIGGNPLQRTRCAYFRSEDPATPCNKRQAGSGCAALHGLNERHAIFGWTEDCVATNPSDPAVALACLDATIVTEHASGRRRLPVRTSTPCPAMIPPPTRCCGPGADHCDRDRAAAPASAYIKVRERESYGFALVSAQRPWSWPATRSPEPASRSAGSRCGPGGWIRPNVT